MNIVRQVDSARDVSAESFSFLFPGLFFFFFLSIPNNSPLCPFLSQRSARPPSDTRLRIVKSFLCFSERTCASSGWKQWSTNTC
jgi:hypothetical protein